MKRLLKFIAPIFLASPLWAAGGGQAGLTVSSGTFQFIDTYNNADGAVRQAIVLGDRISSDTAHVDTATGLMVSISTTNSVTVVGSTVGVVNGGAALSVTATNTGFNVNNTPAVTQSGNWNIGLTAGQSLTNSTMTVVTSTIAVVNQSGQNLNVNIAAGSIANTGFNVTGTLPAGSNSIGNVNINSSSTLTTQVVNTTISVVGLNGAAIPVSGSFSANSVNVSTAAFNGIMIGTGTVISGVGWTGLPQTFRTDVSSDVEVYVTNLSTQQIVNSTVSVVGLNGGNIPTQVNASTISVVGLNSGNVLTQVLASTVGAVGMYSDNGVLSATNRLNVLAGIYVSSRTSNLNGTSPTVGRDAAIRVSTDGTVAVGIVPTNSQYSYSASTNSFTLASNPTVISGICGNSSNTTLVTEVGLSCTQTTAGIQQVSVISYTAQFTGAWSTITAHNDDSQYTVVQSSAIYFTANPSAVSEGQHLDDQIIGMMAPATVSPNDFYMSPTSWKFKPIVLRGAAQCIALNLEQQAVSGAKCSVRWRWVEDPSR